MSAKESGDQLLCVWHSTVQELGTIGQRTSIKMAQFESYQRMMPFLSQRKRGFGILSLSLGPQATQLEPCGQPQALEWEQPPSMSLTDAEDFVL